jgi:hypothetical protein
MSDDAEIRIATADERRLGVDCLRCGSVVVHEPSWDLRIGGHSGGANFLFGALAELGEGTVRVDVSVCPACGHIEFRTPQRG